MSIIAIVAFGLVIDPMYVADHTSETLANINNNLSLYYIGIIGWGLITGLDLIVSVAFYKIFIQTNRMMALLSAGSRLIYTTILALAVSFLFSKEISSFMTIWGAGLIIFGIHLIITGIATFKALENSKVWGILLIIAGAGYMVINTIFTCLPDLEAVGKTLETIMMVPMTLGELGFGVWLIIKGGKNSKASQSLTH